MHQTGTKEAAMSQQDIDRLLIVGTDDGESFWVGGHKITIKAGGTDTDGHYGLIVSRASVGSGPPLHVHRGVDEAVWIIQGQVRFRCGERDFTVGAGTFVLLPRDVPHTFLVVGEQDAIMLGLLAPGGSERYFADIGVPVTSPTPPPPGPPDPEAVRRADERWNTESVVGPPLRPRD
jgi:mannose-6-phosphate isomerase-like protein (cupin superfamily)